MGDTAAALRMLDAFTSVGARSFDDYQDRHQPEAAMGKDIPDRRFEAAHARRGARRCGMRALSGSRRRNRHGPGRISSSGRQGPAWPLSSLTTFMPNNSTAPAPPSFSSTPPAPAISRPASQSRAFPRAPKGDFCTATFERSYRDETGAMKNSQSLPKPRTRPTTAFWNCSGRTCDDEACRNRPATPGKSPTRRVEPFTFLKESGVRP